MMKISGTNGTSVQAGQMNMLQAVDTESKNIQNRIASAQQQLQQLATNEELSVEEKVKKRQELRQQIIDLNNQLRQHQMEQRKEKQQEAGSVVEEMSDTEEKESEYGQETGVSKVRMKAIISADSAMSKAKVYGSVTTQMEGRAGSLQSEIQLDNVRGADTEKKEAELAKVEKRAANAKSSQIGTLGTANKEIKEAWKKEQQEEKTKGTKTKKTEQVETGTVKWKVSTSTENTAGNVKKVTYNAMDIRF